MAMPTMPANAPTPGQVFRHYKGNRYVVLHVGLIEATLTPCVVYQAVDPGHPMIIWVRPLESWLGGVRVGEEDIPRFAPEE